MALMIRFAPLAGVATLYANGRSYATSGAAYLDVPFADGQVIGPDQNAAGSVPANERPSAPPAGFAAHYPVPAGFVRLIAPPGSEQALVSHGDQGFECFRNMVPAGESGSSTCRPRPHSI
jgi:hypothetical protein